MISSSFLHGHSTIAMANAAAADLFAVHSTHCTKAPRAHSILSSSQLALTHCDYKTASRPRHRDEVFSVKLKLPGSTRAVTLELKPEVDKQCRSGPKLDFRFGEKDGSASASHRALRLTEYYSIL